MKFPVERSYCFDCPDCAEKIYLNVDHISESVLCEKCGHIISVPQDVLEGAYRFKLVSDQFTD